MKRKFFKILLIGIIITSITGALIGCGKSGSSESGKKLTVLRDAVMTGQLDQYATEVGKWKGIFEKHGIDLKTTEFVAGINTIDSVVSGTADIGMMADYALVNRLGNTLNETNLKIFSELSGAGVQNGGLYVAPKYENNLSALDGSEGFMTMTGTVSDYYTSKAIEYLNLKEESQNIINTDSATTQLSLVQSGKASAIVSSGSNTSYLEKYGWKLVVPSKDLKIETGVYFLATDTFISQHKELLAEYLKALDESARYINNNLDEVAKYLESKLGVKAEDFKLQWQSYVIKNGFSEEAAAHLEDVEKWAYEHKRFQKDYNIRDFIDTSVVEIAFPDNVTIKK